MFPFHRSYFILSTVFISTHTFAAPLSNAPTNSYDSFIEFLVQSNCSMPSVVELPFPEPSDTDAPFSYLSNPLRECQTPDALKESDEAKFLCNEIFEVLQNITCVAYKTPLPEIRGEPLSKDVCKDFKTKQIDFPKKDDYLSWRLVDPLSCKLFCAPGKYDHLCETLLWSHDLQVKIKSALKSTEGDNEVNKSDLAKKSSQSIKVNLVPVTTDSLKQKNNNDKASTAIDGDVQASGDTTTTKKEAPKSDNLKIGSSNDKTPVKHETSTVSNQKESSTVTINTTKAPTGKTELKPNNEELKAGESNESLQGNPGNQEQNELQAAVAENKSSGSPVDSYPETVAVEASNVGLEGEGSENGVVENQQPLAGGKEAVINPLSGNNIDNSATKVSAVSVENKSEGGNSEKDVEDKQKSKSDAAESNVTKVHANENAVPKDTENELNNVNLDGQENESKVKESNLKTASDDGGKEAEKPILADFESPNGLGSEVEAKATESTTLELLPDKDEEERLPEKYPDAYNDNESEEYAKSDYENSFDPSLKNKEVDSKNPDLEGSYQIPRNYESVMGSRNNIERVPDEGPLISAFPEQEDSHFFFYFLSIVLILMAGYLIFHNKQKIIALIVEGRHERRRRSHGSGYKKLETK